MSAKKLPLCPAHRGNWQSWRTPRYENTRPCLPGEPCAECVTVEATHARLDKDPLAPPRGMRSSLHGEKFR